MSVRVVAVVVRDVVVTVDVMLVAANTAKTIITDTTVREVLSME